MIDARSLDQLQVEIRKTIDGEKGALAELRAAVRPLRLATRKIQPFSTTAISLVGTDGGNNQIQYDPFLLQLIRVVDSSNNEYCLEVISPRTPLEDLNSRHFGNPGVTALGRMMLTLGKKSLREIASSLPNPGSPKTSWVQVYRELTEWAVLLDLIATRDFGTDTVLICDGFLRTKVFRDTVFIQYREAVDEAIARQFRKNRRRIFLAGIAKHSKVLQTYQLAMSIEGVLRTAYPSYVQVPRELEMSVYNYSEYARDDQAAELGGEANKQVGGKMFLVKFGSGIYDPVWPIDIWLSQIDDAPAVLGYLLNDALDGFPVPFYPQSLQRAHEHAALVDFDMDILQDEVVNAIRTALAEKGYLVDEARLQTADVAARRYR